MDWFDMTLALEAGSKMRLPSWPVGTYIFYIAPVIPNPNPVARTAIAVRDSYPTIVFRIAGALLPVTEYIPFRNDYSALDWEVLP